MAELSAFTFCRKQMRLLFPEISEQLLNELAIDWRLMQFNAKEHLTLPNTHQPYAFFIAEGLVRAYYPSDDEDVSVNFIKEGEFATHYTSLEQPLPSRFGFQAIEPTVTIAISYSYITELCQRNHEAERLVRRLIEVEYARSLAHLETFLTKNAEMRYRLFLAEFAPLMNRISITDLASYLGVSRQSLTLIRKKLLAD